MRTASARKSGRNPSWPYVPLIVYDGEGSRKIEHQIRGRAFPTREAAIRFAQSVIDYNDARKANPRPFKEEG